MNGKPAVRIGVKLEPSALKAIGECLAPNVAMSVDFAVDEGNGTLWLIVVPDDENGMDRVAEITGKLNLPLKTAGEWRGDAPHD